MFYDVEIIQSGKMTNIDLPRHGAGQHDT